MFPAHPSVPGPSFCNLRSFFGVLTHSCAPNTWNSNMCCAMCSVQMCLCSPTCFVGDIWQCTPTPNHAHQYPAVHSDRWLSPPAHGSPTGVRHALHPNPHPPCHTPCHKTGHDPTYGCAPQRVLWSISDHIRGTHSHRHSQVLSFTFTHTNSHTRTHAHSHSLPPAPPGSFWTETPSPSRTQVSEAEGMRMHFRVSGDVLALRCFW